MSEVWTFHSAGRIVFDPRAAAQVGHIAARLGLQRVFIVTDQALIAAGLLDGVRSSLVEAWLFSELPTEVFAVGRKHGLAASAAYNYIQLHLGFPDDAMALIDWTSSKNVASGYYSMSAIGSRGAAYADDHHNMNLLFRGDTPEALNASQDNDDIATQLHEFATAIQDKRPPAVTAHDARQALHIAEAMLKSLQSGQALKRVEGDYEFA